MSRLSCDRAANSRVRDDQTLTAITGRPGALNHGRYTTARPTSLPATTLHQKLLGRKTVCSCLECSFVKSASFSPYLSALIPVPEQLAAFLEMIKRLRSRGLSSFQVWVEQTVHTGKTTFIAAMQQYSPDAAADTAVAAYEPPTRLSLKVKSQPTGRWIHVS